MTTPMPMPDPDPPLVRVSASATFLHDHPSGYIGTEPSGVAYRYQIRLGGNGDDGQILGLGRELFASASGAIAAGVAAAAARGYRVES